jgi:molybdate transport system substrate-binding protein
MTPLRTVARLSLILAIVCGLASRGEAEDAPVIAAASDLKFALEEIAARFKADTGSDVTLVFGSSGNFQRQILEGAPFEMFLSADEELVSELASEGKTADAGALYAIGRIALFVPHGSALRADPELADLKAALADGRLQKFAIANPEHAPYGRRSEEALRHAGLWEEIKDRLVLGENVAQAAQFVTSGSAQGGIIAYSLALSPAVSRLGTFVLIPADWHEPLRQRMVLRKDAGETAHLFFRYMQEEQARTILRKAGFLLPGDEP